MGKKNSIVVGLDIGTSKVLCRDRRDDPGKTASKSSASDFIPRKGYARVVINIEGTVNSVKKAIEEAGLMAGCEIHSVFTSISGGHIRPSTATASWR